MQKFQPDVPVQIDSNSINWVITAPLSILKNLPKWFTPKVEQFVTRINHKLPLYVSLVPDLQAWNIDALNISWSGLVAYAYRPTALLLKVVHKVSQYNCLLILIATGWPGMPWFWGLVAINRNSTPVDCVSNSTQAVQQPSVSKQPTVS